MTTETFPQAQPTTAAAPMPTLRDLIAVVAADLQQQHPALRGRIERAVVLASTPLAITAYGTGAAYQVQSACDPTRYYIVDGTSCSCPDRQQRGAPCKHVLAVWLYREAWVRLTARLRAADYGLDRVELTAKGLAAAQAAPAPRPAA